MRIEQLRPKSRKERWGDLEVDEKRISISREIDIAEAISWAFSLSESAGFKGPGLYTYTTAVSELSRNILKHAGRGSITVRRIERGSMKGVEVVASDNGPGLGDIGAALRDHYSTCGGLGLGLSGVMRLMDEFYVDKRRKV